MKFVILTSLYSNVGFVCYHNAKYWYLQCTHENETRRVSRETRHVSLEGGKFTFEWYCNAAITFALQYQHLDPLFVYTGVVCFVYVGSYKLHM